ncbi:MAG: flagellar protein [Vallitaleaceae bacterium]|nr:flagellar protein [Vallitaleaceae bacterium]
MNVRNCVKCGKIFNYVAGPPICVQCRKALEDVFKDVRVYIRDNPEAGINEVAEANDVDVRQIRQWIREERLSFSSDSAVGIDCERCGKSIRTGRFCDTCKAETLNNLNHAYEKPKSEPVKEEKKDTKSQMRFLNKDHR